jgi:hypothetical protein
MEKKQLKWFAAYSCAVTAVVLVLGSQASIRNAKAQVAVPPTYDTTRPAETHDATDTTRHQKMSDKEACKASDLIGMNVRSTGGDDNVGSINDLMIDHSGQVKYVAVSFGGFLGLGDKLFAVPMEAIEFVKLGEGDDADVFAQGFDKDNWPDEADRSFVTSERVGRAETPSATQ